MLIILSGFIQLPYGSFDALWGLRDSKAALLYLFVLRHGRWPEGREAEEAGFSREELRAARTLLEERGLADAAPPDTPDIPPQYSSKDIAHGLRTDQTFAALRLEIEHLLGKVLSSEDLKSLYTIYDWRGLPAEVLLLLTRYMVNDTRDRFGEGCRPPTFKQLDKEAALWEAQDIRTLEAAERYVAEREGRNSRLGRILRALGISGRAASATERKYAEAWIALGFDADAAAIAYDRTVVSTGSGRFSWPYCDKIMRSWHEAGLHTASDIERGDRRPANTSAPKVTHRTERSNRPIAPLGQAERAAMDRVMKRRRKEAAADDESGA